MFLKTVTELDVDFDRVRAALVGRPHRWLEGLADAAEAEGGRLLVDVGLDLGGREVTRHAWLEVGEAVASDRIASLPLGLHVESPEWLFPSLEGSLDAAWLGHGRTHLALTAQYAPPFGLVGRVVDRALLHRVAEAVAQRFVEGVARELATGAAPAGRLD